MQLRNRKPTSNYNSLNEDRRGIKRVLAGMLILALCSSLLYPLELQAAENPKQEMVDSNIMRLEEVEKPENATKSEARNSDEVTEESRTVSDQERENAEEEKQSVIKEEQNVGVKDQADDFQQWEITEKDLVLEYDDRYSLSDIKEGWEVLSIKTEKILSKEVVEGENTGITDSDVIIQSTGGDGVNIIASGVGTAKVFLVSEEQLEIAQAILEGKQSEDDRETIEVIQINVTVEPADLTLMYIAGQSNAEGWCSSGTGYRLEESVVCPTGEVYSTYTPLSARANQVAGVSFSKSCNLLIWILSFDWSFCFL